MKEVKNDIIKKLSYKDYVVYIKEQNGELECYLQNERYAVVNFMFGIYKKENTIKDFIDMIENNIEDYIEIYKQDYEI